MQKRHCTGADAPTKPVSDDKLVAPTQLLKKEWNIREVVAVIRITDDDISAARGRYASSKGVAIPLPRNVQNDRTQLLCNVNRVINTPIIGKYNLTINSS